MPPSPNDRLAAELLALQNGLPFGRELVEALRRDGFTPTFCRAEVSGNAYLLRVEVRPGTRDAFGLAPELLVLAVRRVQAQDLKRASLEPARAQLRLDADLVVVSSTSEGLAALASIPGHGQRVQWVAPFEIPLRDVLLAQLPSYDIFDERNPVVGLAVVGRKDEISSTTRILQSGGALSILGLRKVGKTTIARAVAERFTETGALVAWVDAQTLIERSIEPLVTAINDQLREGATDLPRRPMERFAALLDRASASNRRVTLFIDEFDLLFEPQPLAGLADFFRVVRSRAQSNHPLGLALIGRDPTVLTQPRLEGTTNPLLAWTREQWVGPMNKEDAQELLRRLGRRVALDFSAEATDFAFNETSGHPLLTRQFGSAVLANCPTGRGLALVQAEHVLQQALRGYRGKQAVREVCDEAQDLLSTRYPGAWSLARDLSEAYGDDALTHELIDHAEQQGDSVLWLRRFGLLGADGSRLLSTLRWHIERYAGPRTH